MQFDHATKTVIFVHLTVSTNSHIATSKQVTFWDSC